MKRFLFDSVGKILIGFSPRVNTCLSLLLCTFLVLSCSSRNTLPAQNIAINNMGYKPDEPKLAFVSVSLEVGDTFAVVDKQLAETVFENEIEVNREKNPATGEIVHVLDFTELKETGTYEIKIPGVDIRSVEFRISENVYNNVFKKSAESFYYQRCGTAIDNNTRWTHDVCHIDDAAFYENPGKQKDVTGGWHDAGDYGKFSVNKAVSLAFLLYLYEYKPQAFTDGQFNIPESGNGMPDLLDEVRWALNWLMKMQRSDGAVYHKVQKKKWTEEYLPQKDPDKRYIYEVSSTATADFVAVTALAARHFASVDSQWADSLAQAAQKGWTYLEDNPEIIPENGFKNPPDVKGGEYGDHNDTDERLWAAVELYQLTGEEKYHNYFLNYYRDLGGPQSPSISWKNVAKLAYYSYLKTDVPLQNTQAKKYLTKKLMNYADRLLKRVSDGGYRIVLQEDEYYWGSNSVLLGYAFDLVHAYELSGMTLYKEAALDQLHYILGRNPFGLSYVTGLGEYSVQNPYHQLSIELSTDEPVPGMVVGGPNSENQLHDQPLSSYPAKNYEDNHKNYMVNETAINYTAPLVYLAGYFANLDAKTSSMKSK